MYKASKVGFKFLVRVHFRGFCHNVSRARVCSGIFKELASDLVVGMLQLRGNHWSEMEN